MLKSRKFVVWLVSLVAFFMIILIELLFNRENLFISELGIALSLISGIYQTSNVFQKKIENEKS